MSWEEVRNQASLAALNAKIAEDALDDCIEYLRECRKRLGEASKQIREIEAEDTGSSCLGGLC